VIAEDRRKFWPLLLLTMLLSVALLWLPRPRAAVSLRPAPLRLNLEGRCGMAAPNPGATQCAAGDSSCGLQFDICGGSQGR
jgi:hypothetical protein